MKSKIFLTILLLTCYLLASRTLPTLERMAYYGKEVPQYSEAMEAIDIKGIPRKITYFEIGKDGDTIISHIELFDSTRTYIKTAWYGENNKITSWNINTFDTSGRMKSTKTVLPDSTVSNETRYVLSGNGLRVKKIKVQPKKKILKEIAFTEFDSIAEIIEFRSEEDCPRREIRIYNQMKKLETIIEFFYSCDDTSYIVEFEYKNGKMTKDRKIYLGRKGRKYWYLFEFIYDSTGLRTERRSWNRNMKTYVTDKYSYDSLGRKIREEWISTTGKVYAYSTFKYEGTKTTKTIRDTRNKKVYTKIIKDTTTGYKAIEIYKRRNDSPVYYRRTELTKDKKGNWIERKIKGFRKGSFGIKRNWEDIKIRKIEYW